MGNSCCANTDGCTSASHPNDAVVDPDELLSMSVVVNHASEMTPLERTAISLPMITSARPSPPTPAIDIATLGTPSGTARRGFRRGGPMKGSAFRTVLPGAAVEGLLTSPRPSIDATVATQLATIQPKDTSSNTDVLGRIPVPSSAGGPPRLLQLTAALRETCAREAERRRFLSERPPSVHLLGSGLSAVVVPPAHTPQPPSSVELGTMVGADQATSAPFAQSPTYYTRATRAVSQDQQSGGYLGERVTSIVQDYAHSPIRGAASPAHDPRRLSVDPLQYGRRRSSGGEEQRIVMSPRMQQEENIKGGGMIAMDVVPPMGRQRSNPLVATSSSSSTLVSGIKSGGGSDRHRSVTTLVDDEQGGGGFHGHRPLSWASSGSTLYTQSSGAVPSTGMPGRDVFGSYVASHRSSVATMSTAPSVVL